MHNPLKDSGLPLFFKISDGDPQLSKTLESLHGQSVRLWVRSLSIMQKEAIVSSSLSGNSWRLASDEGAYLAGQDEAPCPLSFLTTGMVCSYMEEILALADQRNIIIRDIKLIQDNYYTMKGSALKGTMIGGAKNIDLAAEIDSDADKVTLTALVHDAVAASPLNGLMRGHKKSLFTLTHNGKEIETDRALRLARSALDSPVVAFDASEPEHGDWDGLIIKGAMTPRTLETVTLAGDSLKEEQDRTLHLRGICTIRPDGIKQVEQQLFNPHGSTFTFLCEETVIEGKGNCQSRAPDAASYIAAGIGFCFMTQFGRHAKITQKNLKNYQIIQDIHFSVGGATGGTGKAGSAAPVETHVYLETGEDDAFARNLLDMAEQTCFLHAFCKADLKAKVTVTKSA